MNEPNERNSFPEAERFIDDLVREVCEANADIRRLADRIRTNTATPMKHWIESFTLSGALLYRIEELGFRLKATLYGQKLYVHPRGIFPALRIYPGPVQVARGVTISVESLAVFRYLSGYYGEVDGTPGGPYSRILLSDEGGVLLFAAERNADVWMPVELEFGEIHDLLEARNLIVQRRRFFPPDEDPVQATERLIRRILGLVGPDRCAALFLEQERRFWEARNTAGRFLKAEQDRLGLGWGNHDHHTFRCRRVHFEPFVRLLESMGFERAEKFRVPNPSEPGWGVLILEHPGIGAWVSVDVDVRPGEIEGDFGHEPLRPIDEVGPVGLWTLLHGESLFEAGLHHLAVRADYAAMKKRLGRARIAVMEPFTDTPEFRQAYVHGERWAVARLHQVDAAESGPVEAETLEKIRQQGALGSFLECTERSGGFRGFRREAAPDGGFRRRPPSP